MKVIDFSEEEMNKCISDSIAPRLIKGNLLIVSIAEGGCPLAEILRNHVANNHPSIEIICIKIKCQRPSTRYKKASKKLKTLAKFFFKLLPKSILNRLRVYEHKNQLSSSLKPVRLITEIDFLPDATFNQIIIVDDAVDTGETLITVTNYISEKYKKSKITTFSYTVTQENPFLHPDVTVKKNMLVRFPWSLDG